MRVCIKYVYMYVLYVCKKYVCFYMYLCVCMYVCMYVCVYRIWSTEYWSRTGSFRPPCLFLRKTRCPRESNCWEREGGKGMRDRSGMWCWCLSLDCFPLGQFLCYVCLCVKASGRHECHCCFRTFLRFWKMGWFKNANCECVFVWSHDLLADGERERERERGKERGQLVMLRELGFPHSRSRVLFSLILCCDSLKLLRKLTSKVCKNAL